MDFLVVVCSVLLALIQSIHCGPRLDHDQKVRYNYGYSIDDPHSGVVTDRWEERDGDYVRGSYSLLEPGGTIRTVNYYVDGDSGFKAVVKTSPPPQSYLSTQQFLEYQELYPQPSPEDDLGPFYVDLDREDDEVPVNYHALNAEYIGYQRLSESHHNNRL